MKMSEMIFVALYGLVLVAAIVCSAFFVLYAKDAASQVLSGAFFGFSTCSAATFVRDLIRRYYGQSK